MADLAERGVMFVLKASLDPAARTLLSSFGKEMDAIQSRTAKATVENSRKAIAIAAEEARAVVQIRTDADTRLRSAVDAKTAYERSKLAEDEQRYKESLERRNKATEEFVKQQNMAVSAHQNNQPISSEYSASAQEAADAIAEFDKLDQQRTKRHEAELKKRLDQEVKAAEKQKQLEERQIARDRTLAESAAKKFAEQKKRDDEALASAIKQADKIVEDDKRKQVALQDSSRRFQEQSRTASREVMNNFLEMGESTMRFARGLTMIGLVGEKDLGKVKDALLGVQGAFDVLSGLGRILTKTDQIMQGLTKATLAQAAAQKALQLANVAGVGTSVATGAAGASIGLGSLGAVASGAAAILTGPFGLVAAGAVAVGGALWLLNDALKDPTEKIKKEREPKPDDPKGFMDLNFSQRLLLPNSERARLNREQEKSLQLVKKSEKSKEDDAFQRSVYDKLEVQKAPLLKEQLTIQEALSKNRFEQATLAEKTKTIDQEIAKYSKDALQGTAGARDEVIRWLEKRKTNEREIAREKRQSATEDLQASQNLQRLLQDQLKTIQQQIEAKRDSNRSALERFGMKSEEEQKDIISIAGRLRAGDKTVTPEDASKVQGFSDELDTKVSRFAISRANLGGARQLFGNRNDTQLRQLEGQRKQLDQLSQKVQMEVKQKTDFIVKLDSFSEADAKKIAAEIDAQYEVRLKELGKKINDFIVQQKPINDAFKARTGTNIQ